MQNSCLMDRLEPPRYVEQAREHSGTRAELVVELTEIGPLEQLGDQVGQPVDHVEVEHLQDVGVTYSAEGLCLPLEALLMVRAIRLGEEFEGDLSLETRVEEPG